MSGLLDLMLPPACAACGMLLEVESPLCPPCRAVLIPLPTPSCVRCSEPGHFASGACPRCVLNPPAFETATAPFVHDGPLARAIHRFKYEDHPELAVPLGALLANGVPGWLRPDEVLLAIPLHAARLYQRKFDQAELLVRSLARGLGRSAGAKGLERSRATKRQVGLTEPDRQANLLGAFRVEKGAEVRGRAIVLVDDVFTTGATARAAAEALRDAGATSVRILTLARAYSGEGAS